TVKASYAVKKDNAVKVTLRLGQSDEVYTVVDGNDLISDINDLSVWVTAATADHPGELPSKSASDTAFAKFQGGANGQSNADYTAGLAQLLNEDAHIILAAGQDDQTAGAALDRHCQQASTDVIKRDRIALVGSKLQSSFHDANDFFDHVRGHNLASDRVIF